MDEGSLGLKALEQSRAKCPTPPLLRHSMLVLSMNIALSSSTRGLVRWAVSPFTWAYEVRSPASWCGSCWWLEIHADVLNPSNSGLDLRLVTTMVVNACGEINDAPVEVRFRAELNMNEVRAMYSSMRSVAPIVIWVNAVRVEAS